MLYLFLLGGSSRTHVHTHTVLLSVAPACSLPENCQHEHSLYEKKGSRSQATGQYFLKLVSLVHWIELKIDDCTHLFDNLRAWLAPKSCKFSKHFLDVSCYWHDMYIHICILICIVCICYICLGMGNLTRATFCLPLNTQGTSRKDAPSIQPAHISTQTFPTGRAMGQDVILVGWSN